MDSHRKLGTFGALHVDRLVFLDDTNQSTDQLSSKNRKSLEIPASRVFQGADAQLLGTSLAGGTEYMDLWPLIATNAKPG